ncbi:hypothetical protein NIES4071_87310 [Calothrix sp. NIES-4071]|nr:hypothetical protein NIES4071_87310 [Calothrix sp. NIES-4071]BAZ62998.1 hypothetical protein NIES4105_87240 [Calothrix sp. NIES-4105]
MLITIEIPEEIGSQLQQSWENIPQKLTEALAVEGYRSGIMTSAQIQQLLKLSSRWETEQFLKNAQAYLDYTEEDLLEDVQTLRRVLPK